MDCMNITDVPYGRCLKIWVQMSVHSGSGRSGPVVIMLTKKGVVRSFQKRTTDVGTLDDGGRIVG